MKSLFPILALASFASVISAQAVPQVEAAAKEVKEKGGVEPPISSLARGLLDASGDLVVKAKDGKLEFEARRRMPSAPPLSSPTRRRAAVGRSRTVLARWASNPRPRWRRLPRCRLRRPQVSRATC
ncbi:hypothetical protein [Verrucomicrobium spinosum]|uniref:hypothetical protein n=1 Tax=Verrucomicrobium spinosum TaxID=2736 RepID=UPI000ACBBDD0|nr:hypothetical protein [Verrucomicrobium spinosum]